MAASLRARGWARGYDARQKPQSWVRMGLWAGTSHLRLGRREGVRPAGGGDEVRVKLPLAVVVVPANTPALQLRGGGSPPLPGPWLSPLCPQLRWGSWACTWPWVLFLKPRASETLGFEKVKCWVWRAKGVLDLESHAREAPQRFASSPGSWQGRPPPSPSTPPS